MTTELDNVKGKIRKLFALAGDKAATEQEAATAMSMATGLMLKYGIEQAALGVEKPKVKLQRSTEATRDYEMILSQAAGLLYGCNVVQYDGGKAGFAFIGRSDNIDAASMTMLWLVQQVESLYKQALPRGLTQAARAEFRRTFKHACAHRVYSRADALMHDESQLAKAVGSTALVVTGYFKALQAENQNFMQETMNVKTKKARPKQMGSGSMAGFRAGDSVKLRKEVK